MATRTMSTKAAAAASRGTLSRGVIGLSPRLAHEPVRTNCEEDQQRGEDSEISDVAVSMQDREADRLQHAENESAGDGAPNAASAPDHNLHECFDRNRSADSRIDPGDRDQKAAGEASQ